MSLQALAETLVEEIDEGEVENRKEVEKRKKELCSEHGLSAVPKNSDVLEFAPESSDARSLLMTKPTRSISGVANVAIMARPAPCGGGCIYCPKGKDAPQSYTGKEPATRRAIRNQYNPGEQVEDRLGQYEKNGHSIDKSKLIIMGGTFPFQDPDYQVDFLRDAFNAMNSYGGDPQGETLEEAKKINETAAVRNVGVTFETRPDIAETEHLDRILRMGGTRVEMGVQTVFDETHERTNRGHGTDRIVEATRRVKNAGFKTCYHLMLGLPGEDRQDDFEKFRTAFSDPRFQPDEVKIYPCEVIQGTELYRRYEEDEFDPISDEEAKLRLKRVLSEIIPRHVRVKRVMRDIPSTEVDAGPQMTNLRQQALQELWDEDKGSNDIRAREVGQKRKYHGTEPESIEPVERSYSASGGEEHFLSFEDTDNDIVLGFLRLRLPEESFRNEIDANTGIVRQIKVLGNAASIGGDGDVQHQGLGKRLMERAEAKAREAERDRLAVISGVGVREYYRKLGYELEGAYMVKSFG